MPPMNVRTETPCPRCGLNLFLTEQYVMVNEREWPDGSLEYDVKLAPKLMCPCGFKLMGTFAPSGMIQFTTQGVW